MDAIPVYQVDDEQATKPAVDQPPLHIASLIAHVQPQATEEIARWLEKQPRVEIHAQSPEGKFAVVMESSHEQAVLDFLDTLGQRPGVLNTALIYHEIIDGEEDV